MVWSPGKILKDGRYTISETLQQKRLSVTYLATSSQGDRVVIKATNDEAIEPEEFNRLQERFVHEAFALQKCNHPHIVKVFPPFQQDNLWCIPMEYIDGTTLDRRSHLKLPETEALRYVRQVGEALGVLHEANLLHRDVTPENIMRRSCNGINEAVLIDFGLVRDWEISKSLTMHESDITAFTAPELCDPDEARGSYTDLYALGAVLYALVTGTNPPKATNRRAGEALPFPVGINPQIATAIEAAMKLIPNQVRPTTDNALRINGY